MQGLCSLLFDSDNEVVETFEAGVKRREVGVTPARLAPYEKTTIIELSERDSPEIHASVLSKAALYADLVVIALPMSIRLDALNEVPDMVMKMEVVRQANARFAPVVKAGRCVFLPRELIVEEIDSYDETTWTYSTRYGTHGLQQLDRWLTLDRRPPRSLHGEYFLYKTIVLPYFPELDLVTVAKIAQNESDSFTLFNTYLRRRLDDLTSADTSCQIGDIMEDVDREIAKVAIDAKKLTRSPFMRGVEMATFAVSIAASAIGAGSIATTLAATMGSVTLMDSIRSKKTRDDLKADLSKSDFYFPYLLRESKRMPR